MDSDSVLGSSDALDLRSLVLLLWSRRVWLALSMLVFASGFAVVAVLTKPVFRATVVLAPAGLEKSGMGGLSSALSQFGGLASLAGLNLDSGDSQTEEALAVLRSREFSEAFIRDQKMLPVLAAASWTLPLPAWAGGQMRDFSLAQGFRTFDRKIRKVVPDKKTGLVALHIEWRDPVEAARWANELVSRLNREMRGRALVQADASVGYLQRELAATNAIETRQAINRLMEGQINQRMLANVTQEFAFRVVDRALPPDLRDRIRPKRALMVLVGAVLGLLVGVVAVAVADGFARTGRRSVAGP